MTTFELNQKYQSNFIGDHNLHGIYTVVKRTAKFITFEDERGNQTRYGLDKYYLSKGIEAVSKYGETIKATNKLN